MPLFRVFSGISKSPKIIQTTTKRSSRQIVTKYIGGAIYMWLYLVIGDSLEVSLSLSARICNPT